MESKAENKLVFEAGNTAGLIQLVEWFRCIPANVVHSIENKDGPFETPASVEPKPKPTMCEEQGHTPVAWFWDKEHTEEACIYTPAKVYEPRDIFKGEGPYIVSLRLLLCSVCGQLYVEVTREVCCKCGNEVIPGDAVCNDCFEVGTGSGGDENPD